MTTIAISDLSILLIEPSHMQLKVIIRELKKEGVANIEGTSSGSNALKLLHKFTPDLVISSMYLPDMTAAELVISMRKTQAMHDIPFMLISSETKFSALNPIRQAGVVAILPKPFTLDDLHRALRSTVEFIDPQELILSSYDIESLRVLVVDDSLMARKHISRVLTNMGVTQITTANDGKEGVEIFSAANQSFDLIITDYNMPEMDGREVIEYIRTKLNNTFIPILMVSSENNQTLLSQVEQAGVSAICNKPFDPQNVKEMLFRVLEDH